MAKNTLINRLSTTSNHVGIALIFAMTNDVDIDLASLKAVPAIENYSSPFSTPDFQPTNNPTLTLAVEPRIDQEEALVHFASKMLANATETDSDIKIALQKGYWDML